MSFHSLCGLAIAAIAAMLVPIVIPAPADRALDIMREADRRQRTDSQTSVGSIEVVDARGKVLNKTWQFSREGTQGRAKILIRFMMPPEVRGVGMLTLNRPGAPAEQWLYTPAIQRDRRVAPQEKAQRFMGTDFTHEDMEERSVEDYDYELIGEEEIGGQPSFKIRSVYKDRSATQYSQLYLWVRKDIVAVSFVQFYLDGQLRRTLRFDDWRQVQGIWTAHLAEMRDLRRNSTTRIRSSDVRFNVAFEADFFSLRNLRRAP